MTLQELQELQRSDVLACIGQYEDHDPADFAMRFHDRPDLPVRAVAEQIVCRRKVSGKLPFFSGKDLLFTPRALEQASGEAAALWKAGLMQGERLLDLTGGLGSDSFFLSRRFDEVLYCERDELHAALADWNFAALGAENISIHCRDGIELLAELPDNSLDWIYVDPDRRSNGRRVAGLSSASPDVVAHHDLLLRKAPRLCIKASPALETTGLQQLLPSLHTVVVLSVEGECREILLLCDRASLSSGLEVEVRAVCLSGAREWALCSRQSEAPVRSVAPLPGKFLIEPDPAIIKSRLTALAAERYGLQFVNSSVDYLTADHCAEELPGRRFSIEAVLPYKPSSLKSFFRNNDISAASIQRRDFPHSPDILRRKFRLAESPERFLFFTRSSSGSFVCLVCLRVG
ncbi:class I SAM-dependent methyltransferase [Prosthecochloris sp. HL-130-GSB]|uniref:THUMP-like domain-containing protein n=1 Tax=Prosthecochloris sp. HL-130-GSB TaxID=1974213 RepID=UPI000A1C0506|nr:class I SAM-dependent methyltransferase [Prosthecochloris sp. HL-130-GSB]ARM31683.1 hypothetical protein B9H02_10720 [Prosthecochloris sp. HL-130-GSB]